ncbi:MAG: bacillithiol system redox-active protein YtxJ [Bacteroidota bacterium]
MNWTEIRDVSEIDTLKKESNDGPIMLFKHSTSCPISSMTLNRLERSWNEAEVNGLKPYILDLIRYREISNQIAESFGVPHESPQVIVLKNGEVVYDTSHMGINFSDLKALV